MIAMALSSTVKAVELKKTSARSPTIPTTSRCATKPSTCSVTTASLHAPLPYASIRQPQLKRAGAFYEEKAVRMLSS